MLARKFIPLFGGIPPYIGQVATRCFLPAGNGGPGPAKGNSQSFHFARENLSQIKVVFPNFAVLVNDNIPVSGGVSTFVETGPGNTLDMTASYSKDGTNFTSFTFSGSTTGVGADGGMLTTDWLPVSLARGDKFYIRTHRNTNNNSVINFPPSPNNNTAAGDAFVFSNTDLTLGGAMSGAQFNVQYHPCAIIGRTTRPSVGIIGDSVQIGVGDATVDATGDTGEFMRALSPYFANINMGILGDRAGKFNASNTNRMALLAYCSHIIVNLGINDLGDAVSAATLLARHVTLAASLPGRASRHFGVTLPPRTTGAWTLADGSDQTVLSSESARTTFNGSIRTVCPYAGGYFDTADVWEIVRNGGKWIASGGPYTTDGIHQNSAALALASFLAAVPQSRIRM